MPSKDSAVPRSERYFEDYRVSDVYESPATEALTEEELIAFARRYDPQPIHLDAGIAANGPYGGLIASGAQTIALSMRLLVDTFFPKDGTLGSPGFDALRWIRPLRVGDTLHLRITVRETRPSQSKSGQGIVKALVETINQNDEVIMSVETTSLMRRRPDTTTG